MKKLIILFVFIFSFTTHLSSQNSSDALRYSRIYYGGTSRFQGMGGAFGALGADFSGIATNPAGLGIYKSSEITVTPSFSINPSSSEFNGETGSDTEFNFALGNFGFVFNIKPHKKNNSSGFQDFNIGFGLNRQNDYNASLFMHGVNNKSSMMTDYVNILNSQPTLTSDEINQQYPFDIALATNANLIYFDSASNRYACDAPHGGVYQQKTVITSGSINEFNFSFGANYNDKLYFGATFGIPTLRYFEDSQYQEYDNKDTIPYFRSLSYGQSLETHGTGINLKVGVIYRPADWFRIGASIHTPTFYGIMKDKWSSYMIASFDSLESTPQYSPQGYYDYQMATPFRAIGSLAFIIKQYGLISAEYEYVNYNQARFYSTSGSSTFSDVNTEIKTSYKSPLNIRFGTEWRIQDFRLRGGFGYYGSPYQSSGSTTGQKYVASGGFGYRSKHFFADLTYVWSLTKQEYYFYDSSLVDPSYNNLYSNNIVMTFGIRF
jgi:hypothetical protein